MADVSPGGTPDQAAPRPAPESSAESTPVGPVEAGVVVPEAGSLPEPAAAASSPMHDPGAMLAAAGRRTGWRRWLPIAGVVAFLAAGAIGMLLFLGVDMGGTSLAVGLTAAVLPVPLLVASFLWLDRYEPEPIRYLAFCFAWGAAIATAVALVVNTSAAVLFDKIGLPDALVAVLVAPFIEELMKAAGPLLLFWRRRVEWSGITDGIVYCGLSALGFAMVENVLYLGKHGYATGVEEYGPATGLQNLFAIFIVRILFTGFAHPLFSAMTGIGLGIAARSGDRKVRWLAPIAGLLLAMILHGTFNLLPTLSVSLSQPFIMLYGYLGFMVPFFFAVVGFAIALRAWEGRLTERVLPFYVNTGWFSPPEVAALGSLGRRYSARQWARRVAGQSGQKAMKSFQFASTQLALLRDGMNRGLDRKPADINRAAAEEQRLLTEILEYRSVFTAKDPQAPQAFWDGRNYQIAFPDGITRTVPPPAEPVVPLPIRFPQPAYAGGWPQHPFGAPPSPYGYAQQPAVAPGYAQQTSAVPGYAQQPPALPGYAQQPPTAPGYAQQPPTAPGYAQQPPAASGYGQQPPAASGYGQQPPAASGYGQQPPADPNHAPQAPDHAAPTSGYGWPQPTSHPGHPAQPPSHPGHPAQPPYGTPPGYAQQPTSASPQGSGPAPSYGPQPGVQPGYAVHPGYDAQPGYAAQPSYGPHPGYGPPPGYGPHPSHGAQSGYGSQPSYTYPAGNGSPPAPGHPTPPPFAPPPAQDQAQTPAAPASASTEPAAPATSDHQPPTNENPPQQ